MYRFRIHPNVLTAPFPLFQGLTIVDVYSEWSGPCSAMTSFLKKIKLEVNDDLLSYAMAKSDTIPQLEIFRGQCKPIWLFMATGIKYYRYMAPSKRIQLESEYCLSLLPKLFNYDVSVCASFCLPLDRNSP